ncbi:MAG: hypothetical protein ACREJ6_05600 [Candidatus Methylomirabilis sp.]
MQRQTIAGALGGLVAALVMIGLMFLGRFTLGTPLIPELMAERLFALIPMELFTLGIRLFGPKAKYLAFWGMVGLFLLIGAILGAVFTWLPLNRQFRAAWRGGLIYGTALWLLFGLLGSPLLGGGLFGTDLQGGLLLASAPLLVVYWIYGLVVALVSSRLQRRLTDPLKSPASNPARS